MRMRREPQDDYLHALGEETNFNESRYYNFSDSTTGFGGWIRMGNRPNEGYAEMTTCLYLPNGQVAFMFGRPQIEGHTAHDAGGLKFEVIKPYEEHRVTYTGKVLLLDEPKQMEDPSVAFKNNPRVERTL